MISRMEDGGKVAILAGLEGAGQSVGRTNGAKTVFENTEGVELVAAQACDWDTEKAYEATKDILTAHPDLKGIFDLQRQHGVSCCSGYFRKWAIRMLWFTA